jgi:hypothetical protein
MPTNITEELAQSVSTLKKGTASSSETVVSIYQNTPSYKQTAITALTTVRTSLLKYR